MKYWDLQKWLVRGWDKSVSALAYLLDLSLAKEVLQTLVVDRLRLRAYLTATLELCKKVLPNMRGHNKCLTSFSFLSSSLWRNQSLKYPRDEKRGTKACNLGTQIFMPLSLCQVGPRNSTCWME